MLDFIESFLNNYGIIIFAGGFAVLEIILLAVVPYQMDSLSVREENEEDSEKETYGSKNRVYLREYFGRTNEQTGGQDMKNFERLMNFFTGRGMFIFITTVILLVGAVIHCSSWSDVQEFVPFALAAEIFAGVAALTVR